MHQLSIGTTLYDLEGHSKVISVYVVICASNISKTIQDTFTVTETIYKKLAILTLAIFQGH